MKSVFNIVYYVALSVQIILAFPYFQIAAGSPHSTATLSFAPSKTYELDKDSSESQRRKLEVENATLKAENK